MGDPEMSDFKNPKIFYSGDDEGSTRGSDRVWGYSKGYNRGSNRGSYKLYRF